MAADLWQLRRSRSVSYRKLLSSYISWDYCHHYTTPKSRGRKEYTHKAFSKCRRKSRDLTKSVSTGNRQVEYGIGLHEITLLTTSFRSSCPAARRAPCRSSTGISYRRSLSSSKFNYVRALLTGIRATLEHLTRGDQFGYRSTKTGHYIRPGVYRILVSKVMTWRPRKY